MTWSPSEQTVAMVGDFLTTLFYKLPYILGIDELLNDCEVIDTDPEGVGTIPRYVTVTIRRYHQMVLWRGYPAINVGDIVTVAHYRQGDIYEIIGAGGATGASEVSLPLLGSYARGRIIRGGATDWEAYNAATNGAALVGDGTDISSTTAPTWLGQHTWTAGGIRLLADSLAAIFGGGADMDIGYDGADGYIRTDLVAPSDLNVDCGASKTLELQTSVWEDVHARAHEIRLDGGAAPTPTAYKSGYILAFPSGAPTTIYFIFEIPHSYNEGSTVSIHLHWVIPVSGAGAGAENVKWDFTYCGCDPAETFPAGATTVPVTVDVQNDVVDNHMVDTLVNLGTGIKISHVMICSLTRDTTVANNYGNAAYLLTTDAHFNINTMGSRLQWVK